MNVVLSTTAISCSCSVWVIIRAMSRAAYRDEIFEGPGETSG